MKKPGRWPRLLPAEKAWCVRWYSKWSREWVTTAMYGEKQARGIFAGMKVRGVPAMLLSATVDWSCVEETDVTVPSHDALPMPTLQAVDELP